MTTLVEAVRKLKAPRLGYIIGLGFALLFAAVGISSRKHHPHESAASQSFAQLQLPEDQVSVRAYSAAPVAPLPTSYALKVPLPATYVQKEAMPVQAGLVDKSAPDAAEGRSIVRTASIDMVVQHPADVAEQITELAEKLGGYLVSANGGGENAKNGTLTVRVPVPQFEEARAEIRKLASRVETEKFDAKDVTQEYVDQTATIRNLRAEEAQYLAMLQQAHTVNDMFFVAQKLSEVRGTIEKQEAQFNTMSHQIETVAIAISLRTEDEQQVLGVNWHELKLAATDGLAEVVNYGMVMATILFNLPALLLWAGTLFLALVSGWRTVQWIRRRWSHWTAVQNPVQG
jgi:hypothetical protein